jgi:arylsulfatase A-like enzyme
MNDFLMKNRVYKFCTLTILFAGVLFLNGRGVKAQKTSKQTGPNIVIIFMDDMGYGDPECYGGGPYHTPNINALAAQGMRFTNFYAAQAVCSASRSAMLTGCYPTRIGISGALDERSKIALNPDEQTIAEILKPAGYKTAAIGKWHLGSIPQYMPLQQGFDEFFGLPYSNDMWPVAYDGKPWADTSNRRAKYPVLPLYEGEKVFKLVKTLSDQDQLTTQYTERAVNFITENKNRPFLLYLAHSMVHVPLGASPKFKGKSGAGLFGDVMEEVDWSVGEVMKALKKNGIDENTLVIFTSDNGPWLTFGNHAGNTGGFREGKGTAWEGGVKVPCIMRWPGKIKPGTVSNNLATNMDVLPTLTSICKTKQPDKKIDGVILTDIMMGKPNANPRTEFVYYYDRNSLKAIRTDKWKLVFPCVSQTYGKPATIGGDGFPGKYGTDSVKLALYNLLNDPGEDRDVKDLYPEIVKQLTAIADKYRKEIGDGLTNQVGTEVRPAAKLP